MKKSFIKVGFMLGLALVTTVSLNSCSSEEDAEGDGTEQTDADNDADGGDEEPEMEEENSGNDMEPEMNNSGEPEAGEGKQAGKGANNMEVTTTVPEEKPIKKSTRGGDSPKMTTDGNN